MVGEETEEVGRRRSHKTTESTFSVQRPEDVDQCLSNSHYLIFGMKRSFCYYGDKDYRDMSVNRE